MKIQNAKVNGHWLILEMGDHDRSMQEAAGIAYQFKPGEYELKKRTRKRSLDANAYCWELCQKIAIKVGNISKEEVYRNAIKEGNSFYLIHLPPGKYEEFARVWRSKGIGWIAEKLDETLDYDPVLAYYGSSVYTTKEMSDLIDRLIEDARNLDIEIISDQDRDLLLERWDAKQTDYGVQHT